MLTMRCVRALLGFILVLSVGGSASAAPLVPCDEDPSCGWALSVDGVEEMNGSFVIDEDGNISLGAPVNFDNGAGVTASIGNIGGNVDPELVFGIGATNSSSAVVVFAFAFNLPLGGFNFGNAISTEATLGTTLTASSAANGFLFPVLGVGKIVDSQDIQFNPFLTVDKGVDIGDALMDPAGGLSTLRNEQEFGFIPAGNSFDLMTVTVAFGLADANQQNNQQGQVGVGFSGRITQVPEPATGLLVVGGLIGLAASRRRS